MPIHFECPHCGFVTDVAERYAGQTGACAGCQKDITIPGKAIAPPKKNSTLNLNGFFAALGAIAIMAIGITLFVLIFSAADAVPMVVAGTNSPVVVASPREVQSCSANLERIGDAMSQYVQQHGHYPPAYSVDENGKPMHSWRVLILPQLGEHDLYAEFDLTKPWNDPRNLLLAGKMPKVYQCPAETGPTDESNYLMIVGEGFVFDKDKERKPEEFTDGLSSTVLVVEVKESIIQWIEPQDLDGATVDWNRAGQDGIGSAHAGGGFHVLTADGAVHHLGDFVSPEALRSMSTCDGGESVDPATWTK